MLLLMDISTSFLKEHTKQLVSEEEFEFEQSLWFEVNCSWAKKEGGCGKAIQWLVESNKMQTLQRTGGSLLRYDFCILLNKLFKMNMGRFPGILSLKLQYWNRWGTNFSRTEFPNSVDAVRVQAKEVMWLDWKQRVVLTCVESAWIVNEVSPHWMATIWKRTK